MKTSFDRLAAINRAITTSLNFNQVLRLIVDNATELFAADNSFLLLMDDDDIMRVKAAHADGELMAGFTGPMEESVVRDLSRHLKLEATKELVATPVVARGSVNGFLAIVRDSPLTIEENWQLSALADQAAIALNNARLHEFQTGEAIRQRDESLAALRESNRKVTNILESITDLYYQLDREWRFTDINKQTLARVANTREELLGKVIWEVFPYLVESELYPQFCKARAEMVPVHFDLAPKGAPGAWYEVHAYPAQTGLTVYLRDITDRKQAEVASSLLAAIVESSDAAIVSKDLNGIINSWNRGAERVFGYSAEEAIGQPATILIPPDRINEEAHILEKIRLGQRIDHFETIRLRKDGSLVDVSLTISPIKSTEGKIVGASKIARDISDHKREQEQIRFQAHLLDCVRQAVIATDSSGTIVYWNSFAEHLYGWSAVEAINKKIFELLPAAERLEKAAEILTELKKDRSWSGEFLVCRKDGSVFPTMVTDSPIFGELGKLIGVVSVSVDISERKRSEQERAQLHESERRARAEAEKANRLKDEFLATLSHELRNPLNVILGYAEILLRSDETRSPQFVKRVAEILKRNALSQSQLVRDLLDLSRLHLGKLSLNREVVSLTAIIDNALETVNSDANSKQLAVKLVAPEDEIFVNADPLRLEQVIWNLLNNAVKFTPAGGTVTIRLASEKGRASVIVEDNGPGIGPDFLPHVFEMFRQADGSSSRSHGGLGIGLALVHQLIELHGGTVAVASSLGEGARFTIELPARTEKEDLEESLPRREEGLLTEMRILVVDDSVDTVDMLRRLFEMDGAFVSMAHSTTEALEIARLNDFDVVLSDLSMPGRDGFEFLRRLREIKRHKEVPVFALSGFGSAEDLQRAAAEGFVSLVTKPIDVNDLLQTLCKLPVSSDKPTP